jgi:hypothetical protein
VQAGLEALGAPEMPADEIQQTLILLNFFESIMVTWLAKMIWI